MIEPEELGLPPADFEVTEADDHRVAARLAELVSGDPDEHGDVPLAGMVAGGTGGRPPSRVPVPTRPLASTGAGPDLDAAYPREADGRRRSFVWLSVAAAFVLVVITAWFVTASTRDAVAPPTLQEMAGRLGTSPDVVLGDGEYWQQERFLRSAGAPDSGTDVVIYEAQWTANDGTGAQEFATTEVPVDHPTSGVPPAVTRTESTDPGSLTFMGFTYDALRGLPEAPGDLRRAVAAHLGSGVDDGVEIYVDLAASIVARPGTRSAALEVLEQFSGAPAGGATVPGYPDALTIEGESSMGRWTVALDRASGAPVALYIGYPMPGLDPAGLDPSGLERAAKITRYGSQRISTDSRN